MPASYLLKDVAEGDREDVLQRERSLFYVAATRARDELVVLWEGEASEFMTPEPLFGRLLRQTARQNRVCSSLSLFHMHVRSSPGVDPTHVRVSRVRPHP